MDMDNFLSILEVTVARVGGKKLSTQQQVGDSSLLNCVKLYTLVLCFQQLSPRPCTPKTVIKLCTVHHNTISICNSTPPTKTVS